MHDKKLMIALAVFAPAFFCVMLFCLIFIISGKASLSLFGFAVDRADRVYVGVQNEIRVYEDGKIVNTITPQSSRNYAFTIRDDLILLSTSTNIYWMDLDGNILKTEQDFGASTFNDLYWNKWKFISENGDEYRLTGIFVTRIIKNRSETVYQSDGLSVAVNVLFPLCFVAMFVFAIWVVAEKVKRNRTM